MKKTTEIIYCDLCTRNSETVKGIKPMRLQIVFTTEQTEGRSTTPYLTSENLDVCPSCYDDIITYSPVYGSGAQGYNKFELKKPRGY